MVDSPGFTMASDPRGFFGSASAMFSVPYAEIQELQLDALRERFESLVHKIPALSRRVIDTGVIAVNSLDDIVPLCFPTSVYKSYPRSWLDRYDFSQLTNWLGQLSIHDLKHVPVNDCGTLDEWLDILDADSPLRVCHSSATSGKMSFLPRTEVEWDRRAATMPFVNEAAGVEDGPEHVSFDGLPILSPFYRYGRSAFVRNVEWNIRTFGNDDDVVTMYPGRMSSDLLLLAGRLRSAESSDDLESIDVPDALRGRLDELEAMVSGDPEAALDEFLAEAERRYGGRQVFVIGVAPNLYRAATRASAAHGLSAFAASSFVHTGGGEKGGTLPDDWSEAVAKWVGVPEVRDTYGMSEVMGANARCTADAYHFNPWTIPFVLDPETLAALPGDGPVQGRLACFDLMAESYWGGTVSTDIVTLTREPHCPCGRIGPRIDPLIRRAEAVDDQKLSCAATPDAHDKALAFLRAKS